MKTKLIFVQESLRLAGSEKSMVTLLKNLDPDKYEIAIQLMNYGGTLEKEVPGHIRFLKPLPYKEFSSQSLLQNLLSIWRKDHFAYFMGRLKYSFAIRKRKFSHSEKAQLFWESIGKAIPSATEEYDAAIGFAQGFPTYYVADKVKAEKKFCWINANMVVKGEHRKFQEKYYQRFNKVICITQKNKEIIQRQMPSLTNLVVLENIVDYQDILKAANAEEVSFIKKDFNILTVGRLNNKSKGMDIAIKAAKLLKDKNIDFHWYFLGEGYYREEMETFIEKENLDSQVTLLGAASNPYPYFKAADLYAQTSRYEGFGRTIAEARLLNVPIVTTNFDTVGQQIIHEKNGLIAAINPGSVAKEIERVKNDKKLYDTLKANLKKEQKADLSSVEKFDRLIEKG